MKETLFKIECIYLQMIGVEANFFRKTSFASFCFFLFAKEKEVNPA